MEIDNHKLYHILRHPGWSMRYFSELFNYCFDKKYFEIFYGEIIITKKGSEKMEQLRREIEIDNILDGDE